MICGREARCLVCTEASCTELEFRVIYDDLCMGKSQAA